MLKTIISLYASIATLSSWKPIKSATCSERASSNVDLCRTQDLRFSKVSCLLTSLSSKCQTLSANQISWTYLNPQLIYNYSSCLQKLSYVRYIGILLPVSISTTSPKLACYSTSAYQVSSKSDVISIFIARHHTDARYSYSKFVRLSVRPIRSKGSIV